MKTSILPLENSYQNTQCPNCRTLGSDNARKFGKTRKGVQRWQCKTCQTTWSSSESMQNKPDNSKAPLTLARNTHVEALPQARRAQTSNLLPPRLWLAFALSSIVLLLGTVILYTLVPLRSPGSIKLAKPVNPVKSSPTAQTAPTAANLANHVTSTCTATSTTIPTNNTSAPHSTCTSGSQQDNPIANPGFEEGTLDHWNCDPNDQVVMSPVHSGQHALKIVPTNNTTGECDQTVEVKPNTSYTLQAYVQGKSVYIGFKGGPVYYSASQNDANYTLLTYTFTTGSGSNLTIFVEGWYGQKVGYADDVTLSPG
jgi:hypothetical protein